METNKPLPILHLSIDTKAIHLTHDLTRNIVRIAEFLKERYKDQYTVIFSPRDCPRISTSEYCNSVILPLHDEDCIKNLLTILDNEDWRPKEKKNDPS